MITDLCDYCHDYIEWCTCLDDCRDDNHRWSEDNEQCLFCKLTREQILNGYYV